MYCALDVAKYIVTKHDFISNLGLQKLLYFIQAEFLISTGNPCFDDPIEAWAFGPVVPAVYEKYKIYGGGSIYDFEKDNDTKYLILNNDKKIIDDVVNQLSPYPAAVLTDVTLHQTPWIQSYQKGKQNIISNELIKEFFSQEKNYERK